MFLDGPAREGHSGPASAPACKPTIPPASLLVMVRGRFQSSRSHPARAGNSWRPRIDWIGMEYESPGALAGG